VILLVGNKSAVESGPVNTRGMMSFLMHSDIISTGTIQLSAEDMVQEARE
jgi:hypothetical protein